MNSAQLKYLNALGIQHWQQRATANVENQPVANIALELDIASADPAEVTAHCAKQSSILPSDWDGLQATVAACTACSLHLTRTQTVFGVGDRNAKLMIIGEAPGFNEDQQGEPFVGRAGQLLTAMIRAMGFAREQVYIANILKCRPPNNRDPQAEEVATCTPFLNQQIALVQPRLLLAVGRIAAHYLLQTKGSLESLRNKVHRYGDNATPLIITYHPAYLLRNPIDKKKAFADLQFTQRTLASDNSQTS